MRLSLIGTVHVESGHANSAELRAILERLQPNVIFAEIPTAKVTDYIDGSHGSLESVAIANYRMCCPFTVVPVDLNEPSGEFFRKSKEMFNKVQRTSSEYRRLIDLHSLDTHDHGFPYLNSDRCAQAWVAIYDEVRATIEWIGDATMRQVYALWRETNDRRETGMLENINDYSSRCPDSHGVFLLGAAHREAIVEKVKRQPDLGRPGVLWNLESALDHAV